MQYIVIIVGVILWLISIATENSSTKTHHNTLVTEAEKLKYLNRKIDLNINLFDRNIDIIDEFLEKISISNYSYRNRYYLENLTIDCMNEICLAENKLDLRPNSSYLYQWKSTIPEEWKILADKVIKRFEEREKNLKDLELKINKIDSTLELMIKSKKDPGLVQEIKKVDAKRSFFVEDLIKIITPNIEMWFNQELKIISNKNTPKKFPILESEINTQEVKNINWKINQYNKSFEKDIEKNKKNSVYFKKMFDGYKLKNNEELVKRFDYLISNINFPNSIPKIWDSSFDTEQNIFIIEIKLPDTIHSPIYKKVMLKKGSADKLINKTEQKEIVPQIHPAITLRIAYEILRNDIHNVIDLLIVNGWIEFNNPNSGNLTKVYTTSLAIKKEQIQNINLSKVNPLTAFQNLKGKSAGNIVDIIPIDPIMKLDREDSRLIDTRAILNDLGSETNLASMDWQDFENLIAELFDKEFGKEGAEVKVTQASRDRGVDAIAFDPDPIRGGKYVIQAKRYTKTVDVSAVRDLCAVVRKEGASRGILVTTSTFGADAYAFANNEPVTLLNGSQLLGLLEKHGYKFRINLSEARKLYKNQS